MFNSDTLEETLELQNIHHELSFLSQPHGAGVSKDKTSSEEDTWESLYHSESTRNCNCQKNEVMLNYVRMCLQIFVEAS